MEKMERLTQKLLLLVKEKIYLGEREREREIRVSILPNGTEEEI